ncbi:MAG TPA: NAD(P)/FAD-dependent oxidoreductase [Burkholderiaceae bacterium]
MDQKANIPTAQPESPPDGVIETDAVIVGAGPVGLFQVFELGLLEIKAHVIDSLAHAGGQCIELYPDKPIYDIPAVPVCTGRELTESLLKQIAPFKATFHLGQEVGVVHKRDDGRFDVQTSRGTRLIAKTLFIAGGVGSFQPRTLKVEGIERHRDSQLHYRVRDPALFAGKNIVIVGGGDSALDWALNFAGDGPNKANVTLVHRRDGFRAAPANVARMHEWCAVGKMRFMVGEVSAFDENNGRLSAVTVSSAGTPVGTVPCDAVLVFFGLSPRLGPIANWGLTIERRQIAVDTERFETNVKGIFAVGDVNTYPGKKKLILSGFHECALAAFAAATYVFPDKRIALQYTTTSPKLHKVLGVETPVFD